MIRIKLTLKVGISKISVNEFLYHRLVLTGVTSKQNCSDLISDFSI